MFFFFLSLEQQRRRLSQSSSEKVLSLTDTILHGSGEVYGWMQPPSVVSRSSLCKQKQQMRGAEILVQSFSVSKQGYPAENSARATITP